MTSFCHFSYRALIEVGTSPNPCSETYPGPKPFSEYETQALADFLNGIDLKLYISFHSYGQYLMYPYGHTHDGSWNDKHLVSSFHCKWFFSEAILINNLSF